MIGRGREEQEEEGRERKGRKMKGMGNERKKIWKKGEEEHG